MAEEPLLNPWKTGLRQLQYVLLDTPEKATELVTTLVRIRHGETEVDEEQPFVAEAVGDTWVVTGSRLGRHVMPLPSRCVVTVRRADGTILNWTYLGPELPETLKERARKLQGG